MKSFTFKIPALILILTVFSQGTAFGAGCDYLIPLPPPAAGSSAINIDYRIITDFDAKTTAFLIPPKCHFKAKLRVLDGQETSIMSMATSALVGGWQAGMTFTETLGKIAPNVAGELAYYGVTYAAQAAGLPNYVSQIAGMTIRSSLVAGFSDGQSPGAILNAALEGAGQGIVSVALQWGAQELNIPPIVAALASNVIGAAIEATLNHEDIFENIGRHAQRGILNFFEMGKSTDDIWLQAVYMSQIINFSEMTREQGILKALETYMTSIFHQDTVNMITQEGGIIAMVTGRAEIITDPVTGKEAKRFWTGYDKKYYVDVDMTTGAILEKKERIDHKDITVTQKYLTDSSGNIVPAGKVITEKFDDGVEKVTEYDDKNRLLSLDIFDKTGANIYNVTPLDNFTYIVTDENGYVSDGKIRDIKADLELIYENGKLAFTSLDNLGGDGSFAEPGYQTDPTKTALENAVGLFDSMIDDITQPLAESLHGSTPYEVMLKAVTYQVAKYGINNGTDFTEFESQMTPGEQQTFLDYALARLAMVDDPSQYSFDFQETLPAGAYSFSLTAIHGMTPHADGWASNLESITVNGEKFVLTAESWNKPGESDGINDGLSEFLLDPTKRDDIIGIVKKQILKGWDDAQANNIPYDVAAHSLGTVIVYEVIKELKVERPDIQIRNLYLMGSPLPMFIDTGKVSYDPNAFSGVQNVVNIYNPSDAMNLVRLGAVSSAVNSNILTGHIISQYADINLKSPSRELQGYFSNVKDVATSVAHGAMWQDERMLRIVEKNGIFTP